MRGAKGPVNEAANEYFRQLNHVKRELGEVLPPKESWISKAQHAEIDFLTRNPIDTGPDLMITKVLSATLNYDHPQAGMTHALKGIFGDANVLDFDFMTLSKTLKGGVNDRFIEACARHHPQWIWLQLQDSEVIHEKAIEEVKKILPRTVITHWTGDARPVVSKYLASVCKATHLTLISSVGMIPMFLQAGAQRVEYLQIGVDWFEDVIGTCKWREMFNVPEVVFIGSYYDSFPGARDRADGVRALVDAGINVGVVGNGWGGPWPIIGICDVKQQHHIWKRAKVAININNYNDVERYYSDRQLIAMVSGTPVVCKYIPGLEKEFEIGKHCLAYNTPSELVEKVRFLLSHEDERKRIGLEGRAEVIRNHTWFSRFLSVIPKVEEIRKKLQG